MTPPKILVMAGGTGGHIFPGIAVAEVLRARGWKIAWMGNEANMEGRLVPPYGYETAWINFSAFRGKGIVRKLALPLNLLRALWQAWRLLRQIRPCVVIGFGGYVSIPGGLMARMLRIPLVVHEQNSVAGMANKVLAYFADRTLSGFPDVIKRAEWKGNPVRDDIARISEPASRYPLRKGPLHLLVIGGSLGAQVLNTIVPEALALIPLESRPVVTHQAGAKLLSQLEHAYATAGVQGELLSFIEDMSVRYAEADLVICRAGALTVAELAAAGVASILVPFPHAVDDHQTGNALFLSSHGAAQLIAQTALTPEVLAGRLCNLDSGSLLAMAEAARELARPRAAYDVADVCESVLASTGFVSEKY